MPTILNPRLILVLILGISCGLPYLLIMKTLGVWLTELGVSKTSVGLFALVGVPYSFKFLWAPLLERFNPPFLYRFLGHRRGWLLIIQLFLMAAIGFLGTLDPTSSLVTMAATCVGIAFLAASQDILVDGLRIEILPPALLGLGGSLGVLGYRIGMIMAGAGALYLATAFGWMVSYHLMAGILAFGMVTTFWVPREEVRMPSNAPWFQSLLRAFADPLSHFMTTHRRWPLALSFIILLTLSDALIGRMSDPFYLSLGFTKNDIATASKLFGVWATIIGGLLGGALLSKFPIGHCLRTFAIAHLLSNSMYLVLLGTGPVLPLFFFSIALENITLGMLTAALVAYMSGLCSVEFSKSQYALLSSFSAFSRTIMASASGMLVDFLGWQSFFYVSLILGLPALALIRHLPLGRFGTGFEQKQESRL